jgi:hypothetical protein
MVAWIKQVRRWSNGMRANRLGVRDSRRVMDAGAHPPHSGWTMRYGVAESYVYELDEIREAESLLLDRVTYEGSRPRGHWATPSSPTR